MKVLRLISLFLMALFVLLEKHNESESVLGKNRPFLKSTKIYFNDEGSYRYINNFDGLSGVEPWGRWLKGKHGQINLNRSLYGNYQVNLMAGCFKLNRDSRIIIKVGRVKEEFIIKSCDKTLYSFKLHVDRPQDYIGINTNFYDKPSDFDMSSLDNRKLSLSLYELSVDEGI